MPRGRSHGRNNAHRKRPSKPIKQLLAGLAMIYPQVFNLDAPLPLARNIAKEIRHEFPGASKRNIRRLLFNWTRRRAYLTACLAPGAYRYQLNGKPSAKVDAVARHRARKLLKISFRERIGSVPKTPTKESP